MDNSDITNYDVLVAPFEGGDEFVLQEKVGHVGNNRFHVMLNMNRQAYRDAVSSRNDAEGEAVVCRVIDIICCQCNPKGRFLECIEEGDQVSWREMDEERCKALVRQALMKEPTTRVQMDPCQGKTSDEPTVQQRIPRPGRPGRSGLMQKAASLSVIETPGKNAARFKKAIQNASSTIARQSQEVPLQVSAKPTMLVEAGPMDIIMTADRSSLSSANENHGINRIRVFTDVQSARYREASPEDREVMAKDLVNTVQSFWGGRLLAESPFGFELLPKEQAIQAVKTIFESKPTDRPSLTKQTSLSALHETKIDMGEVEDMRSAAVKSLQKRKARQRVASQLGRQGSGRALLNRGGSNRNLGLVRQGSHGNIPVGMNRAGSNRNLGLARAGSNRNLGLVRTGSNRSMGLARTGSNRNLSRSGSNRSLGLARTGSNRSIGLENRSLGLARSGSNRSIGRGGTDSPTMPVLVRQSSSQSLASHHSQRSLVSTVSEAHELIRSSEMDIQLQGPSAATGGAPGNIYVSAGTPRMSPCPSPGMRVVQTTHIDGRDGSMDRYMQPPERYMQPPAAINGIPTAQMQHKNGSIDNFTQNPADARIGYVQNQSRQEGMHGYAQNGTGPGMGVMGAHSSGSIRRGAGGVEVYMQSPEPSTMGAPGPVQNGGYLSEERGRMDGYMEASHASGLGVMGAIHNGSIEYGNEAFLRTKMAPGPMSNDTYSHKEQLYRKGSSDPMAMRNMGSPYMQSGMHNPSPAKMPIPYNHSDEMPIPYSHSDEMPIPYSHSDEMPIPYSHSDDYFRDGYVDISGQHGMQ